MRWLDEFLHPSRKCARVGHIMVKHRESYFELPDMVKDTCWTRYVAVEVAEITPICSRCGLRGESVEEDRRGLHGLTMDSERFAALRRGERVPR